MTGGPSMSYGWHPSAQDQRLSEIWNKAPGGATLSKFNYQYNAAGQITTWRREGLAAGEATEYAFGYDPAGQLLDAVLRGVTSQTVLQSYGYGYDSAGNRTKEIVGNAFTAETAHTNGLNQLATRSSGTALPIRGTTNEPVSAVTINGQPAKISGGNRFEGTANVTAGNNTVTVAATDYGQPPNTTNRQYQVAVAAGANQAFSYDDSGNMLNGGGRTFEWDSLDRLTAVIGGVQRTEFRYDGLGRRTKITEKINGTVTSAKRLVWDGVDIAEERVASTNALTKRFYGTGMQVLTGPDAGRYVYTRDHLGSIREAWKMETASLAVRYDYDPYGRRTTLEGTGFDADFGFTGHYTHLGTGLILTLYRPYDANIARWLSRDPIEEAGGIYLYGYVGNDPILNFDPLGLWQITITAGAGWGGRFTIGKNNGRWNAGLQGGAAGGVTVNYDTEDSKACREKGFSGAMTLSGSLGLGRFLSLGGEVGYAYEGIHADVSGSVLGAQGGLRGSIHEKDLCDPSWAKGEAYGGQLSGGAGYFLGAGVNYNW